MLSSGRMNTYNRRTLMNGEGEIPDGLRQVESR